jgi:transcriptional regulator of acetoin/glycerol metabolism
MPAPRNPSLSALWHVDPQAAIRRVRKALRDTQGNVEHAAVRLNVGRRTLFRWLSSYPEIRERERETPS